MKADHLTMDSVPKAGKAIICDSFHFFGDIYAYR